MFVLSIQSEYIAECDKRREFISSFTGSAGSILFYNHNILKSFVAGVAVVTADNALLWTDGRYHLQASEQLDHNWTLMKQGLPEVPSLIEWIKKVYL